MTEQHSNTPDMPEEPSGSVRDEAPIDPNGVASEPRVEDQLTSDLRAMQVQDEARMPADLPERIRKLGEGELQKAAEAQTASTEDDSPPARPTR